MEKSFSSHLCATPASCDWAVSYVPCPVVHLDVSDDCMIGPVCIVHIEAHINGGSIRSV